MGSDEIFAKAMRMMELAKTTMNASRRRAIMDDAFELTRQAKTLRRMEPRQDGGTAEFRYRVWFEGDQGSLYFDLPVMRRLDAVWAAEALAAALSEDYQRYALWDRQTLLLHGRTSQTIMTGRTALGVSEVSQRIVLEAEELAAANHEVLSRSRRLLEATAKLRRIVTPASEQPGMSETLP